ncbi:MAG TPA: hypothetical protein VK864_10335 [Longimicrobiales bacterium]|nr:hypothetical protein [Longimicrobiales bacterium]
MNPAELANLHTVLGALKDAAPGTEIELADGARARVEEDVPGSRGVEVSNQDGSGWRMRVYDPAAERPASYPADLPFVPNTNMSITTGSEGNVMAVWETSDPDALFDHVFSQAASSEWQAQPDNPLFAKLPGGMRMRELRLAERTRVIMRMNAKGQGIVAVFDS